MLLTRTVLCCLLLALITYGLNYHISKGLFHAATLLSLANILLAFRNKNLDALAINKQSLSVSFIFFLAALIAIISSRLTDNAIAQNHEKNFAYPLFFFSIIILSLKPYKNDYKLIFYSAIIGCITMAWAGIYDYVIANSPTYRTSGTQNMPIIYASGMALLTSWIMAEFFNRIQTKDWPLALICFMAILIGFFAIIFTASRGPIIATTLVFTTLFIRYLCSLSAKRKIISVLVITTVTSLLTVYPFLQTDTGKSLISRFQGGVVNTSKYIEGVYIQPTSIGVRLDMWKAALITISEHPFLGIGIGSHHKYFFELSNDKKIHLSNALIQRFDHVHNDALQILMSFGLVFGFVSLLFILYPSYIFSTSLRTDRVAVAGAAVCLVYILCGLTDATSFRANSLSLFLLITTLILSLNTRNTKATHVL